MHFLPTDRHALFCYTVVCEATDQKLRSDTNSGLRFRSVQNSWNWEILRSHLKLLVFQSVFMLCKNHLIAMTETFWNELCIFNILWVNLKALGLYDLPPRGKVPKFTLLAGSLFILARLLTLCIGCIWEKNKGKKIILSSWRYWLNTNNIGLQEEYSRDFSVSPQPWALLVCFLFLHKIAHSGDLNIFLALKSLRP